MPVNNASRNWLFQDHLYFSRSLFTSNRFRTKRNNFSWLDLTHTEGELITWLSFVLFSLFGSEELYYQLISKNFQVVDSITDKFWIIKHEKTEQVDTGFLTAWSHFPLNFYILLNNILKKKSNSLSHNVTITSFTYCKLHLCLFHNTKYIAGLLSLWQTSL